MPIQEPISFQSVLNNINQYLDSNCRVSGRLLTGGDFCVFAGNQQQAEAGDIIAFPAPHEIAQRIRKSEPAMLNMARLGGQYVINCDAIIEGVISFGGQSAISLQWKSVSSIELIEGENHIVIGC